MRITRLCFIVALCAVFASGAVVVGDSSDFYNILDQAQKVKYDINVDIILETDLDFSDNILLNALEKLPLGYSQSNKKCHAFTGTFDGQGHVVKNLIMNDNDGLSGLVCGVKGGAVIKNLVIDSSCLFHGETVGIISVNVLGDVTIQNVTVHASTNVQITGGGLIGTVVGSNEVNNITITMEDNTFDGTIDYENALLPFYIGCFIGSVYIPDSSVVENSTFRFLRNVNNGNITISSSNIAVNVGGIIGGITGTNHGNVNILVSDNINNVNVQARTTTTTSSYRVGGIIGYIEGDSAHNITITMENNINDAVFNISSQASVYAGGYISHIVYFDDLTLTMNNNTNDFVMNLNVRRKSGSGGQSPDLYCGGYVGYLEQLHTGDIVFQSNTNNATITVGTNNMNVFRIGGFISHMTFTQMRLFQFNGNVNDGKIHAETESVEQFEVSGFVAQLGGSVKNVHFDHNINNADIFVEPKKETKYNHFAGLISFLSGPNEVHFCNNINNGNIYLESLLKPTAVYIAGHVAHFTPSLSGANLFCNNINYGIIEGSISQGSLNVGGVIGLVDPNGYVSLCGNMNNATINMSITGTSTNGYVGGIVGLNSNSKEALLLDNANYGNVIGHYDQKQQVTTVCGLICNQDKINVTIQNCVNHGKIEGASSFGLSNFVNVSNNVVNIGGVVGTNESYSLWKDCAVTPSSVFALNDTRVNCDENVTLFEKNKTDGQYHVMNDDNTLVNSVLNEEAQKNGYSMRWDNDLILRTPIVIHILSPVNEDYHVLNGLSLEQNGIPNEVLKYHLVPKGVDPSPSREYTKATIVKDNVELVPWYLITISGEMDSTIYVKADGEHRLYDISNELKTYFDSKDFVVGNSDTHSILKSDHIINGDMHLIVLKKNMVLVEIEESSVRAADIDLKDIAESVSELTGIGIENILVDYEMDKDGYVVSVTVVLKDGAMCEKVVADVNALEKDGQCEYGVLCRSQSARIVTNEMSGSGRVGVESGITIFFIFMQCFFGRVFFWNVICFF